MKIQLDTVNKTIKLESNSKLKDFFDLLNKILPNGDWESFTLETNVEIHNWRNPIIIEKQIPYYPNYPQWYCTNDNKMLCSNASYTGDVINLELKSN